VLMIRSSDTSTGNRFFCSPIRPDGLWGSPSLLVDEKKWKGLEAHHSSPSSAEVKYECSYIDTHGVYRQNVTFAECVYLRYGADCNYGVEWQDD
jgi:hypothetical protein